MKISAILNETNSKFEEQKRYLQRKEAKDTYKKNASYTQASKNPMLSILENLLSGKTEKELFEKQESKNDEANEFSGVDLKSEIMSLPLFNSPTRKEKELDESILSDKLQARDEIASANEDDFDSISDRSIEINIPNRFLQDFNALNFNSSDIKKSIDTVLQDKNYKKAVTTYNQQMEMARQGYVTKSTMYSICA